MVCMAGLHEPRMSGRGDHVLDGLFLAFDSGAGTIRKEATCRTVC